MLKAVCPVILFPGEEAIPGKGSCRERCLGLVAQMEHRGNLRFPDQPTVVSCEEIGAVQLR